MDGTEYITLKEAGEISGYSPDYVGQLIRRGKLEGKQVYANVAWVTTKEALRGYLAQKGKSEKYDDDHSSSVVSSGGTLLHSNDHLIENSSSSGTTTSEQVFATAQKKWERIYRAFSLFLIVCSIIFLILLFHVLSTLLDERLEQRALERAAAPTAILPL